VAFYKCLITITVLESLASRRSRTICWRNLDVEWASHQ